MNPLQKRMLDRLAKLRVGTTICPGQLARECDSELADARADLLDLAASGRVVLSQRGQKISLGGLKGPFRVRLAEGVNPPVARGRVPEPPSARG